MKINVSFISYPVEGLTLYSPGNGGPFVTMSKDAIEAFPAGSCTDNCIVYLESASRLHPFRIKLRLCIFLLLPLKLISVPIAVIGTTTSSANEGVTDQIAMASTSVSIKPSSNKRDPMSNNLPEFNFVIEFN